MSRSLDVYLHTELVGQLALDDDRRMRFQYGAAWLDAPIAVPLSLALPLRAQAFDDVRARPFFANLLPESELRRMIARKLGLSEQNDFALLEAVGGECAGAVSLLPAGKVPQAGEGYRPLNDAELNDLIRDLPRRPMLAGEQGMRLSLAGAQNKLPVFFDGEQISLPINGAPSSHILKPPVERYPDSVFNEAFCMELALRAGLFVPQVTLLAKQQPLYLVERYDRRAGAHGLQRIHQEDFCQALAIPPDQKYEKEGGPTLQQCFTLLREHSLVPVQDIQSLLKWSVFNYLIGNADAHAKNISLLLTEQGPMLAPFYDLMSTAVYPDLAERIAMRIGGEDRPDWIIKRRWQQFAEDVGIGFKLVRQTLEFMKEQVSAEAQELAQGFLAERQAARPITEQILSLIEERKNKITHALAVGS
jgi:serine/threonine-protein kinase HipA